jgi:hypothetical protein
MPIKDKDTAEVLRQFDLLPDDAVVPTRITAAIHGVSERTVRRRYPAVQLTINRKGYRVGTLRAMSRAEKPVP